MTAVLKEFLLLLLLFLLCLLHGARCAQWAAILPETLEVLSGSCVVVPCSFTLPPDWDQHLDPSCRAVWKRGSWSRTQVFDSGLSGAGLNLLPGNLTGNLTEHDCTTVFNNLPPNHHDHYYFRLHCDNALKFNFQTSVVISAQESLPVPVLSPSRLEVEEGSAVRLSCSAAAPCPALPPRFTWTPPAGDVEERADGPSVSSVMNFSASHVHDGLKIWCAVVYRRQAGHSDVVYESSVTVRVYYGPRNLLVSSPGPVEEGGSVTLTCSADANPPADTFTWFRVDGDQVSAVGSKRKLSVTASEGDAEFFCSVGNGYGTENSSVTHIDVLFPPKDTTVIADPSGPVLEGSSVSLVCQSRANPPVINFTWYRDHVADEEVGGGSVLVLNQVDQGHAGEYRCRAQNPLGQGTSAGIRVDVQHPPRNTSVLLDPSGPAPDGSPVTLSCSSEAEPAALNFTWFRVAGRQNHVVGSEPDFTFNASKSSEEYYYCEALNVHGAEFSQPVRVQVTFAPEIQPSSRCVRILSQVRCSCDGRGNPLPSLLWELAGEPVNHSADVPIREVPLGDFGARSVITLRHVDEDAPSLLCLATNTLGSHGFAFNVSSSETHLGFHALSLLIGSTVGALGMLVVCVPLLLCCKKRKRSVALVDTSEPLLSHKTNTSHLDLVHVKNGSLVKEVAATVEVYVEAAPEERELNGLDSKMAIVEIRLPSRECNGGNVKEAAAAAGKTNLGPEEGVEVC